MTEYERWLAYPLEDGDLVEELRAIADKPEEISDRFYQDLAFGTGGLRGVLGAGTNRMNIYTVRKATQGLANYLNKRGEKPSVAIAYDSRNKSELFAREAAGVLAANGVAAHIYPWLSPTPTLSYAVRYLKCDAGICVTASHNPAKYNGYKAYGADGCQVTAEMADEILNEINALDIFADVRHMDFEAGRQSGLVRFIDERVLDAFLDEVYSQRVLEEPCGGLKVVYTPLNGTGRVGVTRILERIGVQDVVVVPEQEMPDGNFTTCPYPNPEIREALQKGLELSARVRPDLLLATDPDCDRCGIAVRHGDGFQLMTGNEVGILLLDFIAGRRRARGTLPERPVLVTTIVSTDMVDPIAARYGVECIRVLTGFKYIGDQIALLEETGGENRFILGFEESYGYLSGGYVRDKDGVDASMLVCEMAWYYKRQGKTLVDAMEDLYRAYGYYQNELENFTFEGEDGMRRMASIMDGLRQAAPKEIAGFRVVGHSDYQRSVRVQEGVEEPLSLPKSNVLEYRLENGSKVMVRPSGTEPKIKIYLSAKADSRAASDALVARLREAGTRLLRVGG